MADFCNQCAKDIGFPLEDMANITTTDDEAYGWACLVLCEGCGPIQVDSKGNCISEDCLEKGHKHNAKS
jgi:hypothetical protein